MLADSSEGTAAGIVHRLEAEGGELGADVGKRHRPPVALLAVLAEAGVEALAPAEVLDPDVEIAQLPAVDIDRVLIGRAGVERNGGWPTSGGHRSRTSC
jgi:hypothetical protein